MNDEERLKQLKYQQRIAKSIEQTADIVASMIVDFGTESKDETKLDQLTVTAQRYYKKVSEDN